jgi:hypothetical protein
MESLENAIFSNIKEKGMSRQEDLKEPLTMAKNGSGAV